MTREHEERLEWAVDVLRETPALPESFLSDFEQKLSAEPDVVSETNLVVTLHPTRGGVHSDKTSHWTAGLVAALLMLCALAGFVGRPKTQALAVKPTGLFVVAGAQDVQIDEKPVTAVVELDTESLLQTGDQSVVLVAGEPGNEIKIGPQSRVGVRIPENQSADEHRSELQLASGSVFITETKAKISVRTSHALVAPIGTDYRVVKSPSFTEVTVLDGSVDVRPPEGGRGVSLQAGQRMTIGEDADWTRIRVKRLPQSGLAPLQTSKEELKQLKVRPEVGTSLKTYPKAKPRPEVVKPKPKRVQNPQLGYPQAQPRTQRSPRPAAISVAAKGRVPKRTRARARTRPTSMGNVKYPVRARMKRAGKSPVSTSAQTRSRAQRPSYQGQTMTKQRPASAQRRPAQVNSGKRTSRTQTNQRRQTQFRRSRDATRSRVNQRARVNRTHLDPSSSRRVRRGGRRR